MIKSTVFHLYVQICFIALMLGFPVGLESLDTQVLPSFMDNILLFFFFFFDKFSWTGIQQKKPMVCCKSLTTNHKQTIKSTCYLEFIL